MGLCRAGEAPDANSEGAGWNPALTPSTEQTAELAPSYWNQSFAHGRSKACYKDLLMAIPCQQFLQFSHIQPAAPFHHTVLLLPCSAIMVPDLAGGFSG